MTRLLVPFLVLLLASSPVGFAAMDGKAQEPPPSPGRFSVAEQREVIIPNATTLALSPDGRWLAVLRRSAEGRELCAYDVVSLAEHRCVTVTSVDEETIAWAPDGSRLAFTEDTRLNVDTDLWVFDPDRGTLTNLTDDGATEDPRIQQATTLLDAFPTWSPDGGELAFARTVHGADSTLVGLFRVGRDGGEPQQILPLDSGAGNPIELLGVRWSPGGDTILYAIAGSVADEGFSLAAPGLWEIDPNGGGVRRVVRPSDEMGIAPTVVDFTSRGKVLLRYYCRERSSSCWAIADLATGQLEPLISDQRRPRVELVVDAAFSPDGCWLAIIYTYLGEARLAVRNLATGGEETVLDQNPQPGLGTQSFFSQFEWSESNLMYVPSAGGRGVLWQLDDRGPTPAEGDLPCDDDAATPSLG